MTWNADILSARGELDEALRLLREEVLAAFERLDEVREKAITTAKIANVLAERGRFREAARMIIDKALPQMTAMGATRDMLVANVQADIYLRQTGDAEGRAEAKTLLCQALAHARYLRIPEFGQCKQILDQAGIDCEDQT